MIALRRVAGARVPQRALRLYSSGNEGPQSTGNPDGFGKREKASEDWYVKQHEKEQLKKLSDEIAKREKELGELKEKADKLSN